MPPAAPQRPPVTKAPRWLRPLIGLGALATLAGVALLVTASLPSRMEPLAAAQPPFATAPTTSASSACDRLFPEVAAAGSVDAPGTVDEQPLSFASSHPARGIARLNGTLALPSGSAVGLAGVVIIHGSGPSDADGASSGGLLVHHDPFPIYRRLAEQLASWGMAALRYDKRSCRACYPNHTVGAADFRFDHFDDDVSDALDALAAHPRVDPQRLLLLGHSQGGQIAAFVASKRNDVAAVITLAGQLDTMEHGLLGQFDAFAELRLAQLDLLGWASLKWSRAGYHKCFESMRNNFVADQECLGGGVTQQALRDIEARGSRTREVLIGLPMPLLMLQGNLDRNISPDDFRSMQPRLSNPAAAQQLLADVGHSFVHLDDRQNPRIAEQAARAMRQFLAGACRAR